MASTSETRNLCEAIPFSLFVSLLSDISKVATKTRDPNSTGFGTSKTKDHPALRVFSRWVAYIRGTFEHQVIEDSSIAIFQLLFPDMDVNRRYDMQEARLAQHLARVFGVSKDSKGRGSCLARWNVDGSSGCLGAGVEATVEASICASKGSFGLDIIQIDGLLTQLASFSSFSHSSVQKNPGLPNSRVEILKTLYSSLSPTEASFLTQIILKDLRPVLYPSKEMHYTAALKHQKSNSVVYLDVVDALKVWDPTLNVLSKWRVVSSFEVAMSGGNRGLTFVGNPLQIPKTVKGTGCTQALKLFSNSRKIWAETKYDGERAQIHVKVDRETGSVELKIFSKSKRESTNDRHGIHQVILDALGLPGSAVPLSTRDGIPCVMSDVILEAEMVAFSDTTDGIDEFWRIRSLVESTAVGPRHKVRRIHEETPAISQCSLRSDASDGGTRHLALVFFDVLMLDSRPLTGLPYHQRRKIMESIVLPIPGFSLLAKRSSIDLTKGISVASAQLKSVLARALADHQEGLVLKADEGAYIKSPWVKLKKDYIPGLGDCVDLVIVGACWEKDRGRELRVPPSAFTTFHLGMLINADALRDDPSTAPSFRAFFSTSYGLGRDQLEDLNFLIKSSNSVTYGEYCKNPSRLGYDMSLFVGQSQPKPSVILLKDSLILAEVFGAGFTKAPGGKYYELRFPRMTKTYRRRDRAWRECISLEEFQRIARETVGRERPNKEADDWCKNLFEKVASPGVKHPLRRKQREEAILADLEKTEVNRRDGDHNSRKRKRAIDSSHHPTDRRPNHRESTYLENVDHAVGGSTSRAVLVQQHGPAPPIPPVTPIRPRLSRRLAPLGSMTNVTVTNPETPPNPRSDDQGRGRLGSGEFGKGGGSKVSKAWLGGNLDPFVEDDRKKGGRTSLNTNHSFVFPLPAPPLSPPTTAPRRKRMDPQGEADLPTIPRDSLTKVDITVQLETEQTTPLAPQTSSERHSQPIIGRSLPTPVSNGPIKRVPPPASSPTVLGVKDASTGAKRKREAEEDAHSPSKKFVLVRSPSSMEKIRDPSRDLKPSGTWSPDETTFMEEPRPTPNVSRSKTHRGDMSVDAIKARLIRATSTLQTLPSHKPETTVRDSTIVTGTRTAGSTRAEEMADPVACEKVLEGDIESGHRKAGSSALTFGIPAPFPPGTSGPGSPLDRPNNSDKIAAYHGADKFYASRPPPSATPPQPPKVSKPTNEDGGKSLAPALGENTKRDGLFSTGQLDQPKLEGSKKALERFPTFVLEPQQLLFTNTPIGKLMSTSVIWFARDVHAPEPSYRPSSVQLVPRLNEVSQLESLLVACGWHRKKAFTSKRGIERGVVFVDYEEQTDTPPVVKTHWVVQQCENAYRLATRYQDSTERGMRPIWIMDARVLRWERLRTMEPGHVLDALEECVLWKKE